MKKSFTAVFIVALLAFSVSVLSQNRTVLYEMFTSNTCSNCPTAEKLLEDLMQTYPGGISSIEYHMWWPAPYKTDPMYNADSVSISARHEYYGGFDVINGIPSFIVDGKFYSNYTSAIAAINRELEKPSPFEMITTYNHLKETADGTTHSIVEMSSTIKALENISGDLRLYFDVIEKYIDDPAAKGTNSSTSFHNVHRQLIPVEMPKSISKGEVITLTSEWKIENFYNPDQVVVVSFIQDVTTQEVHQATTPYPATSVRKAYVSEVRYDKETCLPSFDNGIIRLFNTGSEALTSADIHLKVNNANESVFSWNGNIPYGRYADIVIDNYTFPLSSAGSSNTFVVYASNLNGSTEAANELISNQYTGSFTTSPDFAQNLELSIRTDSKPQEITWTITDSRDNIVFSGGPYIKASSSIVERILIPVKDCYTLNIYDSGNDGVTNGYVKVYETNGTTRIKELLTLSTVTVGSHYYYCFSVNSAPSEIEKTTASRLSIYPNPSSTGIFEIEGVDSNMGLHSVVYSTSGTRICEMKETTKLDLSHLEQGVYFLKIITNMFVETKTIIICK